MNAFQPERNQTTAQAIAGALGVPVKPHGSGNRFEGALRVGEEQVTARVWENGTVHLHVLSDSARASVWLGEDGSHTTPLPQEAREVLLTALAALVGLHPDAGERRAWLQALEI